MTNKASTTQYLYLSGKAMWARLYRPDEKYQNYSILVELDDKSLEAFKKTGLNMKLRDNNGVSFKRPVSKVIKGELVTFSAPKVVNSESQEIHDNIGNGSDVIVKICVYNTVKGPGHRLDAVMVKNLIPYETRTEQDGDGFDFKPF